MFEAVIKGLIWLAMLVGLVFVGIWVLGELGIVIPAIFIKILFVIVVLLVILYIYRVLKRAGVGWLP